MARRFQQEYQQQTKLFSGIKKIRALSIEENKRKVKIEILI